MVILASGSPRRHELLRKLCSDFVVEVSDAQEVQQADNPKILAVENARLKASSIAARHPDAVVIGADTIVVLDGEIFGKPDGVSGAEAMGGKVFTTAEVTEVYFGEMTAEEIREYVATGEPLDKSGSYALQGGATKFIEKIHGDWSNVVGLPVYRLRRLAQAAGLEIF